MQSVLLAQRAKYLGRHASISMMRPIENLRFDQRFCQQLGNPFARRVNVFAKIGMMNETFAAYFQLCSQLAQVRFHDLPVRMHERIETENEIH